MPGQISFAGTLALDVFQIRISRIVFQYVLRPSQSTSTFTAATLRRYKWLVEVYEDPLALRLDVECSKIGVQPNVLLPQSLYLCIVHLNRRRSVDLTVYTGRNDVDSIKIYLSDPNNFVTFVNEQALVNSTIGVESFYTFTHQ